MVSVSFILISGTKLPEMRSDSSWDEKASECLIQINKSVSSVAQSCLTLYDPMNHSTPVLPVHHNLLNQTHRAKNSI